jgi:ER-bound oxygenase mpaB/B'/Rubber oxygenase, catalytic domain
VSTLWTNELLDEARLAGDPRADRVVEELFREGTVDAVNDLMRTLVTNDGLPSELLPAVVRDYLASTSAPPSLDPAQLLLGEEVFGAFGPEILAVLGFYSLPADYAAKRGVQVLYRTGRLLTSPIRRVFETTQMVVDVMSPGGLGPEGRGIRTAQKVRLMHAAVRHLLQHQPSLPWDAELGFPINQEDLAGTLMSFSYLVLDGLDRLGVELTKADRDAYFHAWMAVGRIMGVRDELIPADLEQARELTRLIHERQIAASPAGEALAKALIEGYERLLPELLRGTPRSLIHFFLDRDPFTGQNIAALLAVPPADWTRVVAELAVQVDRLLGRHEVKTSLADAAFSFVSRHLIEGLLLVERGGRRAPFTIPGALQQRWRVGAAARAGA